MSEHEANQHRERRVRRYRLDALVASLTAMGGGMPLPESRRPARRKCPHCGWPIKWDEREKHGCFAEGGAP